MNLFLTCRLFTVASLSPVHSERQGRVFHTKLIRTMLRDSRKHPPLSPCLCSELLEMEHAVGKASVFLYQHSV